MQTWDTLQREGWQGLANALFGTQFKEKDGKGLANVLFCENSPESIHHLFLHCHFSKEVWAVVPRLLAHQRSWEGKDLINTLHTQIENTIAGNQALALEIIWFWLACNESSFEDKKTNPVGPLKASTSRLLPSHHGP